MLSPQLRAEINFQTILDCLVDASNKVSMQVPFLTKEQGGIWDVLQGRRLFGSTHISDGVQYDAKILIGRKGLERYALEVSDPNELFLPTNEPLRLARLNIVFGKKPQVSLEVPVKFERESYSECAFPQKTLNLLESQGPNPISLMEEMAMLPDGLSGYGRAQLDFALNGYKNSLTLQLSDFRGRAKREFGSSLEGGLLSTYIALGDKELTGAMFIIARRVFISSSELLEIFKVTIGLIPDLSSQKILPAGSLLLLK